MIGASQDEIEDVADSAVERVVDNHRDVVPPRTLDEVVLDLPDLRQRVQVLLEWPEPLGRLIPHPEVTPVQVLVLDRHDALDDERARVVGADHPRNEMDTLDDRRPVFRGRAFQSRVNADEHVPRLIEKAENRRVARLLREARLKSSQACLEDVRYGGGRNLDKALMAQLGSCQWIRAHQNLILTGATGCGKTWLACALGNAACRQGLSVVYVRTPRLFEELRIAHGDGSFGKRLSSLAKTDLLILDDWGLAPLNQAERNDLLEVLDDRVGTRSTVITSQLPVEHWHAYLNDPTLADAILDRVLHSAHKLALAGESLRKPEKDKPWPEATP